MSGGEEHTRLLSDGAEEAGMKGCADTRWEIGGRKGDGASRKIGCQKSDSDERAKRILYHTALFYLV